MPLNFKITLGEVPDPDHMPIGMVYSPTQSIAVIQPQTEIPHLIRSLKSAIKYTDWNQWMTSAKHLNINPQTSWENPNSLTDKLRHLKTVEDMIPPEIRV